ncbi:MAG TPA: hypothetical protein VK615_02535 [Candidatus Binatia bacterium]|nr:hypothetical protein [Candidatus Binatia bacterium]
MKWSQVIAPLVAMAIAAIGFGFFQMYRGGHYRAYLAAQGRQIGRELIATTNSAHLVALGPRLREQLATYLVSPTDIQQIKFGDVPAPAGNGQAAVCVFLTNATNQRLVIRLHPSTIHEKFDLIGFWLQTN